MLLPLSGLLAGVKPRVKLLALAIPYSWNPNEQLGNDFSLGHFNIGAYISGVFWVLQMVILGWKPYPKPASKTFWDIDSTQLNPRGQSFWPFSHE